MDYDVKDLNLEDKGRLRGGVAMREMPDDTICLYDPLNLLL